MLYDNMSKAFLDGTIQKIKLNSKVNVTHDTIRFRFELPSTEYYIGLPPGKHVRVIAPNRDGQIKGQWNHEEDSSQGKNEIERPYTPVTGDELHGYVEFVIKIYQGQLLDKFPDGGKMSQYLKSLSIGDHIKLVGPKGLIQYHDDGLFTREDRRIKARHVGMIAGGTGITPMLHILRHILHDPNDRTEVSLLFANKTEEDILTQDMLEEDAKKYPQQFHLYYTIDKLTSTQKEWNHCIGHVNDEMCKKCLPTPADDALVLICGPKGMSDMLESLLTEKVGWKAYNVFRF